VRYRPSYVSRQSGIEKISRATIATAPTIALDSSGSCVLRLLLPGDRTDRELTLWRTHSFKS